MPIFHAYGIEDKISQILNPIVQLPSGGTIVIDKTEALTAIDVNSGKSKNGKGLNETILKINLEAASEVARQIKLRDIAGIIVVDFIDMETSSANENVERRMKEVASTDNAHIQIGKISGLGLMEISRQRMHTSFPDNSLVRCPHCCGVGKIMSVEAQALSALRQIEKFLATNEALVITAEVACGIDLFILNRKRRFIAEMESACNVSIEIVGSPMLKDNGCNVTIRETAQKTKEKEGASPKEVEQTAPVSEPASDKPIDNKPAKPAVAQITNKSEGAVKREARAQDNQERLLNKTNFRIMDVKTAQTPVATAPVAPVDGDNNNNEQRRRRRRYKKKAEPVA
jgi:ribonuclease E